MTAGETVRAHTRVVADTVQTRGSVLARRYRNRQKTRCVRGDLRGTDTTRSFYILTRSALVRVDHAVTALESGGAGALVRPVRVLARGAIPTGRGQRALVHVLVTQPALPSDRALARKVQEVTGR